MPIGGFANPGFIVFVKKKACSILYRPGRSSKSNLIFVKRKGIGQGVRLPFTSAYIYADGVHY
jgi:hypothetical protein